MEMHHEPVANIPRSPGPRPDCRSPRLRMALSNRCSHPSSAWTNRGIRLPRTRSPPLAVAALLKDDPDGSMTPSRGATVATRRSGRECSASCSTSRSCWPSTANPTNGKPRPSSTMRPAISTSSWPKTQGQYPWAESLHQALLESGARELRLGRSNFAWRCFHDVLRPARCRRQPASPGPGRRLARGRPRSERRRPGGRVPGHRCQGGVSLDGQDDRCRRHSHSPFW